jgi:hypothetical protein
VNRPAPPEAREELIAMYATVRRYVGNEDLADQLKGRRDEVKALIEDVPGFVAYYLIKADDGAVSITVCQDRSGAEESNSVAASWLRENMPEVAPSPPEVSAGEVVIQSGHLAAV